MPPKSEYNDYIIITSINNKFKNQATEITTKNNYVGYPYFWHIERAISIDRSHDRVFCTRSCMDQFLSKHSDILIPIFFDLSSNEFSKL